VTQPRALAFALLVPALFGGAAVEAAPPKPDAPKAVAVLYFDNTGDDRSMDMLRKGLAQMMISGLVDTPGLKVIERQRLQEVLGELKLNESKFIDKASAQKVGKLLGARMLVMGAYFEMMGTFRIDARVVATETGEIVASKGRSGKKDAFSELITGVTAELRTTLMAGEPGSAPGRVPGRAPGKGPAKGPDAPAQPPKDDKPPGGKAPDQLGGAMAFSEGLDYADRKDFPRARDAMRRAVDLDPGNAEARKMLAQLDAK